MKIVLAVSAALLAVIGGGAVTAAPAVQQPGAAPSAALARWARGAAVPLDLASPGLGAAAALDRLIGDARIVLLGEALHGSAEPLAVRNALFRHLVERGGFTAVVLESGIVEGFGVDDFVHGGNGTDAAAVAARGITFGLGGFPQQAELIDWMRAYNRSPAHSRKISFYGMDVSAAERASEPRALDLALAYLDTVAPATAAALRNRVAPASERLWINRRGGDGKDYTALPQALRDTVSAAIADLLTDLDTHEAAYIAATDAARFARGRQTAVAARQADTYLRQFPVGWKPADGPVMSSVAVADRAKSDNIDWIAARHQRILVFTHLAHAAHTTFSITLPGSPPIALPPMVGTYLQRHYGSDAIAIGQVIGEDRTACGATRPPAGPDTIEGVLRAATPSPLSLLDLRKAPQAVRAVLAPRHDLYGQQPTHALSLGDGLEALLFAHSATPAASCATGTAPPR